MAVTDTGSCLVLRTAGRIVALFPVPDLYMQDFVCTAVRVLHPGAIPERGEAPLRWGRIFANP